jgi:hypothetical protein
MPDFTITISAAQATRVSKAFGRPVAVVDGGLPTGTTWHNATQAEVLQAIKDFLKTRVQDYESQQAAQAAQETVQAETW